MVNSKADKVSVGLFIKCKSRNTNNKLLSDTMPLIDNHNAYEGNDSIK